MIDRRDLPRSAPPRARAGAAAPAIRAEAAGAARRAFAALRGELGPAAGSASPRSTPARAASSRFDAD